MADLTIQYKILMRKLMNNPELINNPKYKK